MKKILGVILCVSFLGCQSNVPPDVVAYKVYNAHKTGLKEAAIIRETPGIPKEVILNLQRVASISYPGMEALADAAETYNTADIRIKALEKFNLPGVELEYQKAKVAEEEINNLLLKLQPLVTDLTNAISKIIGRH